MRRDCRLGFRIEAFLDLHQWQAMEIGPRVPLTTIPLCPADEMPLRVFCTFTDDSGSTRLRVGCCPSCGHVSYMDRPTQQWVDHYYLDSWDSHSVEARTYKKTQKLAEVPAKEKTVVALTKALDLDRRRPVCEIGCGWGASLKNLMLAGFQNVIGTDASAHRAQAVREGLGVPVVTSPFESEAARKALAPLAPFSVIFSNHVLEHTYDPDAVIAAAARMQDENDYLILAVPNQDGEPPMGVLMFLPHLHSFTRASLTRLAARHGYTVVDDSHIRPRQLVFVFQKRAAVPRPPAAAAGVFDQTVARYVESLDLDRWHVGLRRLWWERAGGRTGQCWMIGQGRLEARRWRHAIERHKYRFPRSVAITSLRRRFTSSTESALEIQQRGGISLFYK